jgi:ethanolamine utilization protein EutP
MLIGKSGSGKTTLTQALQGGELRYCKTQSVDYTASIIDTPGEYMENRRFYAALRATASDCTIIALVQDACDEQNIFPPLFAAMFSQQVVGIITKVDAPPADCKRAEGILRQAGATKIIRTSAFERLGLDHPELIGFGHFAPEQHPELSAPLPENAQSGGVR